MSRPRYRITRTPQPEHQRRRTTRERPRMQCLIITSTFQRSVETDGRANRDATNEPQCHQDHQPGSSGARVGRGSGAHTTHGIVPGSCSHTGRVSCDASGCDVGQLSAWARTSTWTTTKSPSDALDQRRNAILGVGTHAFVMTAHQSLRRTVPFLTRHIFFPFD
jgi:hypothetical protein